MKTKNKAFYDSIMSSNDNFVKLSEVKNKKIIWLFSNEIKDVLLHLATFVYECYQLKTSVLKETYK